jgi:hypothetical protein
VKADPVGDGVSRKCWPVAHTHADALKLVDFFGLRSAGVRPAEISIYEDETLEISIGIASDEGCEFVICPVEWADGVPVWGHLDIRPTAESEA